MIEKLIITIILIHFSISGITILLLDLIAFTLELCFIDTNGLNLILIRSATFFCFNYYLNLYQYAFNEIILSFILKVHLHTTTYLIVLTELI